jgi:hypothetical protein
LLAFPLECLMTLGRAPQQADLWRSTAGFCEGQVAPGSIYGILHRECFTLFPDEMFADLFDDAGRRSVPPMIVAVVMVLQRIESLADRCVRVAQVPGEGGLAVRPGRNETAAIHPRRAQSLWPSRAGF